MIFVSKNEKGKPAYEMVMERIKTVTRRSKPQPVGAIRAVQPGRTKAGIGHIKIVSCMKHYIWMEAMTVGNNFDIAKDLNAEAVKEGFETWHGLSTWFIEHKISMADTYRIEFVVVD